MSAEQIRHHRAAALIRNVQEVYASEHLQEFSGKMVHGAGARRGKCDRARLGLRQRDEFAQIPGGHRRMDDEHVRIAGDERNRSKVLQRIEGYLAAIERRVRRQVVRLHDQGVAVGCRANDGFRRDQRVAARTVVDHDLLSHALGHPRCNDPGEDIGPASWGEGHEQPERPVREALREDLPDNPHDGKRRDKQHYS